MRYLTIALAKGRLADKAMEMFEAIGISCDEMKDKASRKLIFVNEDLGVRFFLAKANDVPTYVEYGAADIGIVGRDTILEEGRKLYEVMDLGVGKCRMCVCGPESARERLEHHELIRVATKYPNIAKDYFYNQKYQTVEINRGYCGDRVHPAGERTYGVGGSVQPVSQDGGKPGEHEDGK